MLARLAAHGGGVAAALNDVASDVRPRLLDGRLLRFVSQAALPSGMAYEAFIAAEAAVPTRDNWHDFFNGLIWLRWPHIKAQFNALHQQGLAQAGIPQGQRGALRDALTLLDENGALLDAPAPLLDALRERDWQQLFVELRPLWARARWQIVGHALLEKLMQARKPICAHLLLGPAVELDASTLAAKPFHPLPVLGVPGWWPGQDEAFYADAQVFRTKRVLQTV